MRRGDGVAGGDAVMKIAGTGFLSRMCRQVGNSRIRQVQKKCGLSQIQRFLDRRQSWKCTIKLRIALI
jgi:tRNA U38,U39,U40 pseudouridine synthase TruA